MKITLRAQSIHLSFATVATLALATSVPSAFAAATPNPQLAAQRLTAIQLKGDTDITARLTSLNTLVAKVSTAKKLSSAQKISLSTEMQGEVTGLTALKAKLDADTDVATARTDFQNIFALHYIYAFYLPRVERIIAADDQGDAASLLTSLAPKLQAYISQAGAQGKDVTALTASLADLQNKSADAMTQSNQVISSLTPLMASGYPGNKSTLQGESAQLKTGRADLTTARADAQSIVSGLKKLLPSVQ